MTEMSHEERQSLAEQRIRGEFDSTLVDRIGRYVSATVHSIIPLDFFSSASAECKDMFVAGSFYGCITLCQSVAEGLSKFIAEKNSVRVGKGFSGRVHRLKESGLISDTATDAFLVVHGEDRNDFHHLNKEIEQDYRQLEARALECLNSLYVVESEVFAYEVEDGKIRPVQPKYWPSASENSLNVYVRFA